MKVVSRNSKESEAAISLLFAQAGAKFRFVHVLALFALFHVITISANAQMADLLDAKKTATAHATLSPSSPSDSSQGEYTDVELSSCVRRLANLFGLSPQTTFQLCWSLNFFGMVALMFWKGWPLLTATFEARSISIRRAIEEAERLSKHARKRLAEVEKLWAQFDSEIAAIQERAEAEMKNEEQILHARTTEDVLRIMEYSKLEIDSAAQQAQTELKATTAVLAVSLARQSIRIDERGDQELIKGFIEGLKHYEIAQTNSQSRAGTPAKV
jgi:F0F1-type ATP synthase membrane subunit b/b'